METITRYATKCLEYIQTIGISDIVDMAIIAYVIYRLLRWTRKTNTGQVLKGILILFAGLWLSYQFNLHVISFVLSKALEIGFLALVVVFQPEIRRFLEEMGSRGIRTVLGSRDAIDPCVGAIDQTVAAFAEFSTQHVGALVVFERKTFLDTCLKSGTVLDAAVSSELLKNIFWPKAPLHDGAVIIRQGRIVGAGCVLPLTSNLNISRDLGTRHRAGIGMSESSDAVVAIVSEETGAISVAVGGMLKRHLSLDTLERLLRNELLTDNQADDRGKGGLLAWFRTKNRGKGGADHVE